MLDLAQATGTGFLARVDKEERLELSGSNRGRLFGRPATDHLAQ